MEAENNQRLYDETYELRRRLVSALAAADTILVRCVERGAIYRVTQPMEDFEVRQGLEEPVFGD